jgi:hypothetical protein
MTAQIVTLILSILLPLVMGLAGWWMVRCMAWRETGLRLFLLCAAYCVYAVVVSIVLMFMTWTPRSWIDISIGIFSIVYMTAFSMYCVKQYLHYRRM